MRTASNTATRGARRHKLTTDFAAAQRVLENKGWTDGLPVVPPTQELVLEMLAHTPLDPHTVLGRMERLKGTVTIETVAANAVMADCRP